MEQDETAFWTIEAILLAPLALFWFAVATDSQPIYHLLFGVRHTPFRDLLPVVILPGIALFICMQKMRRLGIDRSRAGVLVLSGCIAFSLFVACGYALSENIHHALRAEVSAKIL